MSLYLGIDVGSTTVKYVVVDSNYNILKHDYKAHNTNQAKTLYQMLQAIDEQMFSKIKSAFVTGSGASTLAPLLNAKFIQEVNAVTLAVEHLHSDVKSCIELGGQDAKIIIFKEHNGKKSVTSFMNDKCASGTGATIQKCASKVGLSNEHLAKLEFQSSKLHFVSAKCGVFAETDVINLLKASVPAEEILNSLANAIVLQNLTTLAKGENLEPKVLLLGGPHKYLPFLVDAWRARLKELWSQRGLEFDNNDINNLIFTPQNAQLYAALGSVIFGLSQNYQNQFNTLEKLQEYIQNQNNLKLQRATNALYKSEQELQDFKKTYTPKPLKNLKVTQKTKCYLGIDSGSTSSKAVLLDQNNNLIFSAYTLSLGNPIEDFLNLMSKLNSYDNQNLLEIAGFGVTGYGADVLNAALKADSNIIETIAHLKGAKAYFGNDIDVVCDVGGQDIKVLFLQNGNLKNFKLSNQCSAGNGALLQAMAKQSNIKLQDFANLAFSAKRAPNFSYGCAVFLDTDRVTFQKEGYTTAEIFAGIAKVLPKNIWQYVAQEPNLSKLGKCFVLQGGTQYNLAALKAQVDYIKAQVPNAKVYLHPYPALAGAIGAALEAKEATKNTQTQFVGIKEALKLQYTTKTDKSTICQFCPMKCNRTFIDTKLPSSKMVRYIAGFKCDRGMYESTQELAKLKAAKAKLSIDVPNLVNLEAKELFSFKAQLKAMPSSTTKIKVKVSKSLLNGWAPTINFNTVRNFKRSNFDRSNIKIAIPRVLNVYSKAPFFKHFLLSLGIKEHNILFSKQSNQKNFLKGARYSLNDPCYPAKVALSHIYNFLFKDKFKEINYIWFATINELDNFVTPTMANTACPIVSGTPRVVYSSFIKEQDLFAKKGIEFIDDTTTFSNIALLKKQLFQTWGKRLQITKDECNFAVDCAIDAQNQYNSYIQNIGKNIIKNAIANNEVIILLLGRPYHLDKGINHEILNEFQALGYKVLTINSIPKTQEFLEPFFKDEIGKTIESPFDIRDVWSENFSVNSAQKVWAAT